MVVRSADSSHHRNAFFGALVAHETTVGKRWRFDFVAKITKGKQLLMDDGTGNADGARASEQLPLNDGMRGKDGNGRSRKRMKRSRSEKRSARNAAKRTKRAEEIKNCVKYDIFERIRAVKPYVHSYETYAKGRWNGRPLLEMFANEFGANPRSYYEKAISCGLITVNGEHSRIDRVIKSGDHIVHIAHRHEPPVVHVPGHEMLAFETRDTVVVNKPSSVTVHPCGAYRYNSLTYILAKECGLEELYTVHRLDRLTSGVVLFGKTKERAQELCEWIKRSKSVLEQNSSSSSNKTQSQAARLYKCYVARVKGAFPCTVASVEEARRAFPGRMADIDVSMMAPDAKGGEKCVADDRQQKRYLDASNILSRGVHCAPPSSLDAALTAGSSQLAEASSPEASDATLFTLSCPLRSADKKNGAWECCRAGQDGGKPSMTRVRFLRYDRASDTSLVCCEPVTGRTHQIRLHLQMTGFPIANDPNYGGCIGDGDDGRPRVGDPSIPPHAAERIRAECEANVPSTPPKNESERLERMIALCQHCQYGASEAFNCLQLRCEGVWLHALRYALLPPDGRNATGDDDRYFDYEVPLPPWAHFEM